MVRSLETVLEELGVDPQAVLFLRCDTVMPSLAHPVPAAAVVHMRRGVDGEDELMSDLAVAASDLAHTRLGADFIESVAVPASDMHSRLVTALTGAPLVVSYSWRSRGRGFSQLSALAGLACPDLGLEEPSHPAVIDLFDLQRVWLSAVPLEPVGSVSELCADIHGIGGAARMPTGTMVDILNEASGQAFDKEQLKGALCSMWSLVNAWRCMVRRPFCV